MRCFERLVVTSLQDQALSIDPKGLTFRSILKNRLVTPDHMRIKRNSSATEPCCRPWEVEPQQTLEIERRRNFPSAFDIMLGNKPVSTEY